MNGKKRDHAFCKEISSKRPLQRKAYVYAFISLLIMGFIFFQSSLSANLSSAESMWLIGLIPGISGQQAEELSFFIRKCAHLTEYAFLGASLYMTWVSWKEIRTFIPPFFLAVLYAVSDEIHQYFVPGRSCEFRDVIIDSLGIMIGIILVRAIKSIFER